MSRIAARCGALALLLLTLAACSGPQSAQQPAPTAGQAAPSTAAPPAAADVVVAYNTPEQWANWGGVLRAFSEQTGISAPSDPKNSGQTLAALEAEAAVPQADTAYYGIVFGITAAEKGLVAPYKPAGFDQIPASLKDAQGRWMAVHQGAIAFLVNTDELGGAPVPQCWADLLKPDYAGKVGFLDPAQAAVGYSVITAANLALGGSLDNFDPGARFFAQLHAAGLSLPAQTATALVQQGEIPILIDADFNGYKLRNVDQAPIEVVLPCEGTIAVPYVMSLVKDAPRPAAGQALLDFALSDAGQRLFAESYLRPIRPVEINPEIAAGMLPASQYERVSAPDFGQMRAVQTGVIERWTKEVVKP
ncbi:MAG TPA: ABC transporter substrate-binding protein [Roseiflexaceae bacterium]|nr:ABC transporter substrate-binding protein [Roseiflexaceae bacterium]